MLGPVALTAVVDSALLRSKIRPSETPFLVLNLYSTSARFTNCRPLAPGSFRMYWRLISRVRRQVGREQTLKGDSAIDFPDGCREPNLAVTCKAVGLIVCTRRIDQTVRPIARCLRGWSGEATDR